MPERRAVVIAVENTADGESLCPGAVYEATVIAAGLSKLGFSDVLTLTNAAAGKSAIESRCRKVAKSSTAGDEIWLVYLGSASEDDGQLTLTAADTQPDDRESTAVGAEQLALILRSTGAKVHWFIDSVVGPTEEAIRELIESRAEVCLTASVNGTASTEVGGRRIWAKLLAAVCAGKAAGIGGPISAGKLHQHLSTETSATIRRNRNSPDPQTPALFGPPDTLILDLPESTAPRPIKLDAETAARLVFRGRQSRRLRELSVFQSGAKVPESMSASTTKWLKRAVEDEIRGEIDDVFAAVRSAYGFKRKELETGVTSDGIGTLRTPRFEYSVAMEPRHDDSGLVDFLREVRAITDVDAVRCEAFRTCFRRLVTSLVFEFAAPIDVADLVDRFEDSPLDGVAISTTSDARECRINVDGLPGEITVESANMRIEGPIGGTPDSLIEQFLRFRDQFGGKKGLLPLPSVRKRRG